MIGLITTLKISKQAKQTVLKIRLIVWRNVWRNIHSLKLRKGPENIIKGISYCRILPLTIPWLILVRTFLQCEVNWSSSTDKQFCKVSNLKHLFYFFSELKSKAVLDIMRSSGCYPKCKTVQYSIHKTETKINWPANWTASVFIFPKSSIVEYSYEYFREVFT